MPQEQHRQQHSVQLRGIGQRGVRVGGGMKVEQFRWTEACGWEPRHPQGAYLVAHLVLLFGATPVLKNQSQLQLLRQVYPQAHFLGCSTAGEIYGTQVSDGALVATAVQFEHTQVKSHAIQIEPGETSLQAGIRLAEAFPPAGLVHVFVLSDGLQVNGSDLVKGLLQQLPQEVTITGGLSGDDSRFHETWVMCDRKLDQRLVAAIGLYGNHLKVGYGSLGGWSPFGPKRIVTKSQGNVLYELDGRSALDLYKKYLGDYAKDLPATGLLFPLSLYDAAGDNSVVRTILAVDEAAQSLTFAGDVPEGSLVQLMQANFDRLVDGAIAAAQASLIPLSPQPPDLAILISCVGRKLVLKQRVEEEVEGVQEVMGESTTLTGFYSYGEIAPNIQGNFCELHNQTMTITTFRESRPL